jgi:hypothetical protein
MPYPGTLPLRTWANGGWGHPQPAEISNGGDGTGQVTRLTWTRWGNANAYAVGRTVTISKRDHCYPVQAELHAYDLGRCGGRLGYRRLFIRRSPRPSVPLSPKWEPWRPTSHICTTYQGRLMTAWLSSQEVSLHAKASRDLDL